MQEDILRLPYIQMGGISVGSYIFTTRGMFCTMKIDSGVMRISALGLPIFTFAPGEIQALQSDRFLFNDGIRLIHSHKRYPSFIVFWLPRSAKRTFPSISSWVAMFNHAGFRLRNQ
jgi:hypothetical protein